MNSNNERTVYFDKKYPDLKITVAKNIFRLYCHDVLIEENKDSKLIKMIYNAIIDKRRTRK